MYKEILEQLDTILKLAEEALTYERIFDLIGISDLLGKMYINTPDLSQEYVTLLYKAITDFIKQPLYKGLDLNKEKDLKFLRSDRDFVSYIKKKIAVIKEKLVPRHYRILEYLLQFEEGKHIPVKEVLKATNYDKASLLLMLDDLKQTGKIYDYNGREVILK